MSKPGSPSGPVVDLAPGDVRTVVAAHDGLGVTRLRRIHTIPGAPFSLLHWEFPPGTGEGAHTHEHEPVGLEHYLGLQGTVTVTVDDGAHRIGVGDSIAVPRNCVRAVHNHGDEPAIVLLVVERLGPSAPDPE